jgi:hypothetical protein
VSRYTPGPWCARPNDPWAVYAARDDENEHAEPSLTICDVRNAGSQVSQDNANLIAAAPELLKACKTVLAHETFSLDTGNLLVGAIAKAEGREP